MELIDRTKVAVQGKTFFVRIPAPLCHVMGIEKGHTMNVYKEGNRIIFEHLPTGDMK